MRCVRDWQFLKISQGKAKGQRAIPGNKDEAGTDQSRTAAWKSETTATVQGDPISKAARNVKFSTEPGHDSIPAF
jgi:hypothetical protein